MQSSRRPTPKTIRLRVLALLPLAAAAVVLAATAQDPPPAPPALAAQAASSFTTVPILFINSVPPQIQVRFNPGVAEATGFRLYLGAQARSAGNPFALGNTPYDLGTQPDGIVTIQESGGDAAFAIDPAQPLFVALTSYNEHGNEGDYSQTATVMPLSVPSVPSVASSPQSITLTVEHGQPFSAVCAGCTVRTTIWRKLANEPDTAYAVVATLNSSQTSFTDSNVTQGQRYTYGLRSFVDVSGSTGAVNPASPFTYSAVFIQPASSDQVTNFPNQIVAGTATGPNGTAFSNISLQAGDVVTISGAVGQVNFNVNGPCAPSSFQTGPNGFPRGQITAGSTCYSADAVCIGDDPVQSGGHAGLFLPAQGGASRTFIGTSTFEFTWQGAAGDLRLGINDGNCTQNSGSFSVDVTRIRPAR